jgi:hypothetical protein
MVRVEHSKNLIPTSITCTTASRRKFKMKKVVKLVSEVKGEMNGRPLRFITAVNTSLIVLVGALREITVSIVGNSKDFAVEVASGSWFESLLIPGVTGFVV